MLKKKEDRTFAFVVIFALCVSLFALVPGLHCQTKADTLKVKTDTTLSRIQYIDIKQRKMENFKAWAEEQLKFMQIELESVRKLHNDSLLVDKKEIQ